MNELNTSGLLLPVAVLIGTAIGLVLWFFVNRASVRANEQIRLLQNLLDEQKKQNALLKKWLQPEPEIKPQEEIDRDFIRVIPER